MTLARGGAPLNIVDGLREHARATPRRLALIDGARRTSYAELHERSSRLAGALLASGLRAGDTVAVLVGNRAEFIETVAATAKAGLVYVPINPRSAAREVDYILEHAECRALVFDAALADRLPDRVDDLHLVVALDGSGDAVAYEALLASGDPVDPGAVAAEHEAFCIAYTSGTTGRPKGVQLSHRGRVLGCLLTSYYYGLGPGTVNVAVAPFYHGAGFMFGYASIMTGGTLTILRAWDPEAALALMERDRVTASFLVPTHAQGIRSLGEAAIERHDLGALRTLYFNAAALPVVLKQWVQATFPHVGVHEVYGSTEAGAVSNLRPEDADGRDGSVGLPWQFTEVRLVDDDGEPVGPGEPGELYARSPYLMEGYLKDDAATEACTTPDGFLTSGDVAIADEDGFLYIVDRKKDMIITGGNNVYPREVEELVVRAPGVREAAVVGLPDETWGELVTGFVVCDGSRTVAAAELDAHLEPLLANYKRPRAWRFVDELPRNAAGKVLKRDLRDGG